MLFFAHERARLNLIRYALSHDRHLYFLRPIHSWRQFKKVSFSMLSLLWDFLYEGFCQGFQALYALFKAASALFHFNGMKVSQQIMQSFGCLASSLVHLLLVGCLFCLGTVRLMTRMLSSFFSYSDEVLLAKKTFHEDSQLLQVSVIEIHRKLNEEFRRRGYLNGSFLDLEKPGLEVILQLYEKLMHLQNTIPVLEKKRAFDLSHIEKIHGKINGHRDKILDTAADLLEALPSNFQFLPISKSI